jgi:CubicO group peptidase (beta-lactamase class C family)
MRLHECGISNRTRYPEVKVENAVSAEVVAGESAWATKHGRRGEARAVIWLLALPLFICLGARAQSSNPSLSGRLESLVDARFNATKCPGLSVAVASKNEIIFSKALGMADVEQGVTLRIDSVHRLGSISKPITGTIIMGLVEQAKLALDASIRQYLPELPETYQRVTLRHLLTHQSGVQGYTNPAEVAFSVTHYATTREAIKPFMDSLLKFEPGTRTEYSSFGFALLGAAAEAVTGRSFQRLSAGFFAEHEIGGFTLDDPLAIVPRRVRGYLVDPNSKITFNTGQVMERDYLAGTASGITNAHAYDISNRYPAGGFDSSADDLLRFVIALSSGKVLKPETVNKMWTAQSTSDGTKTVFGLGWGVSNWKGNGMVGMNGAEPASTTLLRYFPDSGVGVTLLCNAEGAQDLSDLLDDILAAMFQ